MTTCPVENPPSGIYYLDLLVPGEAPDELFDNQDWNDLSEAQMDAEIITNLRTAARDAGGEGDVASGHAGRYAPADVRRDTEHG